MKKNIVSILILFTFFPLVASASWWNPFSWKFFKKSPTAVSLVDHNTSSSTISSSTILITKDEDKKKISELEDEIKTLKSNNNFDNKVNTIKENSVQTPKEKYYSNDELRKAVEVLNSNVVQYYKTSSSNFSFLENIRNDMTKYQNNQEIQTLGKKIYDNVYALNNTSDQLIESMNDLVKSIEGYINTNKKLSEQELLKLSNKSISLAKKYKSQNEENNEIVKKFVKLESNELDDQISDLNSKIESSKTINNQVNKNYARAEEIRRQIEDLNNTFQNNISALSGRGVPESIVISQKQILENQYRAEYAALQAEYQSLIK